MYQQISEKVTRDNYVGVVESIEFDDTPMGLWNFEAAENNFVGARERYQQHISMKLMRKIIILIC